MQNEYRNSIEKRQITEEASMELLARITDDARRSGTLRAEEIRPAISVYKSTRQHRVFLPIATAAAVLAVAVLALFILRQARGTRFTPGPGPRAGGDILPGSGTSESTEESVSTTGTGERMYEDITSAAPPSENITVYHTSPPTETPLNPNNPDPSVPMEQIVDHTVIVEIREDGLKREIRVSGKKHRLQIPFPDAETVKDDRGISSILNMIAAGCNVPVTSDPSWQDAPPEIEMALVQNPPFNKLMEAINLSIFGVNNPADDQAAGYRKATVSGELVFESEERELFLQRTRKNIDDGYPVIVSHGDFLLIEGYLEADNGEMIAIYYRDPSGAYLTADIQMFLEMISSVQHMIFYLW